MVTMPSNAPSRARTKIVSAGYGPAVSSGISVQSVDAVPDVVVDVLPLVVDVALDVQHADRLGHALGGEEACDVLERNV